MKLAIFDLDGTLLDGDSDELWCDFLIAEGLLERERFKRLNAELARDYQAGTVSAQAFYDFHLGLLAGRTPAQWQPLCRRFVREAVLPRVFTGAAALLQSHRQAGDLLLLSTATNRAITALTAQALGFEHLLATECALDEQGCFNGHACGVLNMREGKVTRLRQWLADRGQTLDGQPSCFYSDSINDRPLLEQVSEPIVTHADARLARLAAQRGWRTLSLR